MPGITVQITGDGAGAAEAIRLIEERMQEMAARGAQMGEQIAQGTARISSEMERAVPRVAAASGAIREFEGTLPIRAVERFLSDTLGLGPALQAAFPLIGAVAFGEMLFHIGAEIKKVMDGSDAAAGNIRTEWDRVNSALAASNDALDTKIDHTIAETDKLLGHPGANNLRIMFDEARDSADKLGISITGDLTKMEEILNKKENTVGFWGGLMKGRDTTGGSEKVIKDAQNGILETVREYSGVLERAGESGNSQNLNQAQVARLLALQNAYGNATSRISKALKDAQEAQDTYEASGKTFGKDETANINLLSEALENLAQQQRSIGAQYADSQANQKKLSLGDGGAAATKAAEQQAKAEESIQKMLDKLDADRLKARQEHAAAELQVTKALDEQLLAEAKSSSDTQLAVLEVSHRVGLSSETDYLEQKRKLIEQENDAERSALQKRASDLEGAGASNGPGSTPKQIELYAQLVAVNTKLAELADQRAKAEAQVDAQLQKQLDTEEAQRAAGLEFLQKGQQQSDGKTASSADKLDKEGAQAATQTVGHFMDQLTEGALKGKLSMKSLVDSAISDIERFAMKIIEERALLPLMNELFGVGGNGLPGGLGEVGLNTQGFANVPAMATGGSIPDGGAAIVGDGDGGSASELFMPSGPGTVLPHDVLEGIAKGGSGGGSGPNVTLNNINNSSQPVSMRHTSTSWDSDAKQFIINTVLEDMQSNGPTRTAMGGS